MTKQSILNFEGRLFLNQGPINPVSEYMTAWAMAWSIEKLRRRRDSIVSDTEISEFSIESLPNKGNYRLATEPLEAKLEVVSERTRMGRAKVSLEIAQQVYHLVGLQLVQDAPQPLE